MILASSKIYTKLNTYLRQLSLLLHSFVFGNIVMLYANGIFRFFVGHNWILNFK